MVDVRPRGGERAVDGSALGVPAAGGSGEELVPGAELSLAAIDPHPVGLPHGDQFAHRVGGERRGDLRRQGALRAGGRVSVTAQRVGGPREEGGAVGLPRGGGPGDREVEHACAHLELVAQHVGVLTRVHLLDDAAAPGGEGVGPGLHAERPHAGHVGGQQGVHGVGFGTGRHRGARGEAAGSAYHEAGGQGVVPLPPDDGRDRQYLADHRFRREPPAGDEGTDLVDGKTVVHVGAPSGCGSAPRSGDVRHRRR